MYEYKIPPIDLDCGVTITQYVIGAKWKRFGTFLTIDTSSYGFVANPKPFRLNSIFM